MKKAQKILTVTVLAFCLMLFGGWTYNSTPDEVRYADFPVFSTYANEVIDYTSRDDSVFNRVAGGAPLYETVRGLTNSCGAVAGAQIVGYYDKYFPELIPDWVSYFPANGRYKIQDSIYVPALIRELYTLMDTNVQDAGVSEEEFKKGLNKYIENHGSKISYQSVMSNGIVDYNACKNAIDSNKILVLFSRACYLNSVITVDGHDEIIAYNLPSAHIMIAYGYEQFSYYNASGLFRSDMYLEVATGLSIPMTALYKTNPSALNAAYIVNIS